jgi:hypothetical protein
MAAAGEEDGGGGRAVGSRVCLPAATRGQHGREGEGGLVLHRGKILENLVMIRQISKLFCTRNVIG